MKLIKKFVKLLIFSPAKIFKRLFFGYEKLISGIFPQLYAEMRQGLIDVIDNDKRPVMADADSISFKNVKKVEISSETKIQHRILFNEGHGLDERLIQEQFV